MVVRPFRPDLGMTVDGNTVALPELKQALLGLLAMYPDTVLARDAICNVFWRDNPSDARQRQRLASLIHPMRFAFQRASDHKIKLHPGNQPAGVLRTSIKVDIKVQAWAS